MVNKLNVLFSTRLEVKKGRGGFLLFWMLIHIIVDFTGTLVKN